MSAIRQTITFSAVGLAATACYFFLASLGARAGLSAAPSSFMAYAAAATLSYCGHRWLTFQSSASVTETGLRFAVSTLAQFALATAIPFILTDRLGQPPALSFATVCVVIPVVSYLVMARFVFRDGAATKRLQVPNV